MALLHVSHPPARHMCKGFLSLYPVPVLPLWQMLMAWRKCFYAFFKGAPRSLSLDTWSEHDLTTISWVSGHASVVLCTWQSEKFVIVLSPLFSKVNCSQLPFWHWEKPPPSSWASSLAFWKLRFSWIIQAKPCKPSLCPSYLARHLICAQPMTINIALRKKEGKSVQQQWCMAACCSMGQWRRQACFTLMKLTISLKNLVTQFTN